MCELAGEGRGWGGGGGWEGICGVVVLGMGGGDDLKKAIDRVWHDALWDGIGGRVITNFRFVDGLAGEEQELVNLVNRLDKTSSRYGMGISAEKTKLMTNSKTPIEKTTVSGQEFETVNQFKYLGAVLSEEGSKTEVLARAAQTTATPARQEPMRRDKHTSLSSKLKLQY